MIEGVKLLPLKRHCDDRGYVMEILRRDSPHFVQFGQLYVSTCNPGIVKAWHCHKKQTDNFCVIAGMAKIGLYDDRKDSPTRGERMSVVIGDDNPVLVQIPRLVWHGQMCLGTKVSVLINVPTELYDYAEPDELRRDPFDPAIGFDWLPKHG
ncbi:MAG TPA: dTDP-4-dehydrorhamnose 3,5-epimerase family protein [bacterium]|nr:dTDP-4-dehydrorhamnose 3,5-epimerase family protein [bacterium]